VDNHCVVVASLQIKADWQQLLCVVGRGAGRLQRSKGLTCLLSVVVVVSLSFRFASLQIKVLDGSSYAWLGEVLAAFNAGDLHGYDALCERHAGALNGQPALVDNERSLREKITILALTELIFK